MHIKRFLHKLLSSTIHEKRLTTLHLLITALISEKKLSLTQLGRALKSKAREKNNIKRCDRFLGNKKLHGERISIYRHTAQWLIGTNTRPLLLVDWSHVPNTTHYLLRASLVAKGRALSIYEEVFARHYENSDKAHHLFLQHLKQVLPNACCPILVTDAGFYNSWFRLVLKQGWDYVGRIRGNVCYQLNAHTHWEYYCDSIKKATEQGQSLGCGRVSKTDPIETFLYLIKLSRKERIRLNKYRKKGQGKKDKVYSKSANEPWLLASSLDNTTTALEPSVIYYKRMQIEQNFRDLKSSQYVFSFEHAYSKSIERIQVLLMIAMLATLIAYLTGFVAENKGWHYHFQANSSNKKRVLSLFYLGCRMIKKKFKHRIDYFKAMQSMHRKISYAG
jgi:hypothetical protein